MMTPDHAIRLIWKLLNRHGRGYLDTPQTLGAILHICMRSLRRP